MKLVLILLTVFSLFMSCNNSSTPEHLTPEELIKKYRWQELASTPDSISAHAKNDDIFFLNEHIGWVIGSNSGTIYKTVDGGDSWVLQYQSEKGKNGAFAYFRSIGFLNEQVGYVGLLDGVEFGAIMLETRDGGKNWKTIPVIENSNMQGVCGISVVNENILLAAGRIGGNAHMALTTDKGLTWKIKDLSSHISMITDSYFWDEKNGIITGGWHPNFRKGMTWAETYIPPTMRIIRTRD